jgi:pilus assembly protein CpaF
MNLLNNRVQNRNNHPEIHQNKTDNKTFLHGSEFQNLKSLIHDKLLDSIDFSVINSMDSNKLRQEISKISEEMINEEKVLVNSQEKESLLKALQDEVLGYGPLESFLKDSTTSDILVNTHNQIYVERFGKLELTDARFKDENHLRKIIDKIVSGVGRRIDESSPMVDARLPDGSRVNAIIPPLALDGSLLSIRRFAVDPLRLPDLIASHTLTAEMGELLQGIVQARLNVLICGGTGSGKTTLLNVLSGFIPDNERIVTIEDSAELQLQQRHVVRLETRPPNIEGKGEVTQRDLVRNSLRMRPDRIVVGEVRGEEAFDMLQAMNTGHDGSLTTIHANSARDALIRVETMVAMTGFDIPSTFLRHYISSAIDIIVHTSRLSDGTRRVLSLQEVTGMEGDTISLQEVFRFKQEGLSSDGKVKGGFHATGIRPRFVEQFRAQGIPISAHLFDPTRIHTI